jgi:hypothetical protein
LAPQADRKVIERILRMTEKKHQLDNTLKKSLLPDAKDTVERWLDHATEEGKNYTLVETTYCFRPVRLSITKALNAYLLIVILRFTYRCESLKCPFFKEILPFFASIDYFSKKLYAHLTPTFENS